MLKAALKSLALVSIEAVTDTLGTAGNVAKAANKSSEALVHYSESIRLSAEIDTFTSLEQKRKQLAALSAPKSKS